MTGFRVARALVVCVLVLFASVAAAAPTRNASPRVVEIHVDGKPAALAQTRTVATEILLRISVIPVVLGEDAAAPRYATPGEPFVRAYFDFRSPAPRVVIVDGNTQRELERRVLPEGATLETSVEAVTHVLYMVVESLLDESMTPKPEPVVPPKRAPEPALEAKPEPVEPAKPAPQSDERGLGLEAGVLLRTMYLGEARLLPGAGVALDLRMDRLDPHFSVAFGAAVHTPVELSLGPASARLQPLSFTLLPSVQAELGRDVAVLVGFGASMTWFTLSTTTPDGVRAGTSAGGADLAVGAVAGFRFRLSSRLAATLSGALDVDLTPRRFIADTGDQDHVLAELPRLRPFVSLTGTYSLLGSNHPTTPTRVD